MRVIYASRAANDFVDIIAFGIETWGEAASRHYVDHLEQAIARLGVIPGSGGLQTMPGDVCGSSALALMLPITRSARTP